MTQTYINDAARISPNDAAAQITTAIQQGRRGVALIFDDDGKVEDVVTFQPNDPHVEIGMSRREAVNAWQRNYEQVAGEHFERRVAKSHEQSERTKGKVEPQVHATDAALAAAKRAEQDAKLVADAKRIAMTTKAKADYAEGVARTAKFANAIKEHNAKHAGR